MAPILRKSAPVRLRGLGLGEKWLQDRIEEDPSILGLGDVQLIRRERKQSSGGRLDFLFYDPEQETRYAVEVMLGSLDESHIIRTIEYWDIERQRYPTYEHRAVIVAEEITARFFNVIRLLNRSVPLIALQLSAFPVGKDEIVLHGIKVLDIYEEAEPEEEEGGEQVDRRYWERRASADALRALDAVVAIVGSEIASARVTYNKGHVALGTSGRNFCWFHPPRAAAHCHVRVRTSADLREEQMAAFEDTGLYVRAFQRELITLKLAMRDIEAHREQLVALLTRCEALSRGSD
ncbi:MAG: hypothetical protein JNL30_02030 [Rubrivivax sp.]|nr:hypothetical protein [Rubrivivax sp.]